MARGKSDISNTAIRIFLQEVGKFYDELRSLPHYKGTQAQKQEILAFFEGQCCYCGDKLTTVTMTQDHLIAMNRESLGLDAWGNVVPSCRACNSLKHYKGWELYLAQCCAGEPTLEAERKDNLLRFMRKYEYEPNLQLADVASNLYEDVGDVAMTLINRRFQQAERLLRELRTNKA